MISEKLKFIKPSPTLEIVAKAIQMKKDGLDVISLSAGEPDFDTPDNVKDSAIAAIRKGFTKYTPVDGILDLKKAIQLKFTRENNLKYDLNQIIVCSGGKQVIYNLFMACLNPSDEVIIPSPYWVSYQDIVILAGGTPIVVECKDNFKLTAKLLENYITAKTKWVVLNSPSNPTGAVYSFDELKAIGEVLKKYPNVNIMSDDIYEHIVFDNLKFYNIAQVVPELKDRTFIVNGVSKSYSMTGWRIGYGAGDPKIIKAMSTIQSQSTSNPTSISQYAALEALTGNQDFLQKNRDLFQSRRDFVMSKLKIECLKPDGAFYLFIPCKQFYKTTPKGFKINNDSDFVMALLQEAQVATVQGSAFGYLDYFRISYANNENALMQACERINKFCESLT